MAYKRNWVFQRTGENPLPVRCLLRGRQVPHRHSLRHIGLSGIFQQGCYPFGRTLFPMLERQERFGIMGLPLFSKMGVYRIYLPFEALFGVAVVACVGRAVARAQVWAGHTQAVVAAKVIAHVVFSRHMAIDTLRTRTSHRMEVVRCYVVGFRGMALRTQGIALCAQFQGVRVMAIAALYPLVVHSALRKRPIYIYFFKDLTVGMV